jgi:hypothetical protein
MNRSPCHGCAETRIPEVLRQFKDDPRIAKMDVRLIIEATTLTSKDLGGIPGLEKLLQQPNVEVRASTIWAEIENVLKQYDQYYDKETKMHFNIFQAEQFKQHANDLQAEIDSSVKLRQLGPKDITKG